MYSLDLALATLDHVVNDFDHPVVIAVAKGGVAVSGNFVMVLGHGRRDGVGVQVSSSRGVNEPYNATVLQELERCFGVIFSIFPRRRHHEIVVVVFVVVTSDLLLVGTHGECLHMRMQQSTSIPKVLDGNLGSDGDLERGLGKVVAF